MATKRFVLSTVGISPLLNALDSTEGAWRQKFNQATNAARLPDDVEAKAQELAQRVTARLRAGDVVVNRKLSAELNGIYGLYDDKLPTGGSGDIHFLVATDTALGRLAAAIICDFLRSQGLTADVYIPAALSTADPLTFSSGMKQLIRWCEDTIPGYRSAGYHVVFNLTAAFKSLQGYLSIMGMFYADEMIYIFETGSKLLSIPRLPLQIDVGALRESRVELAMMAQGHVYAVEQVSGVPAGLLDIDESGSASLSDWGALVWNRVREELLGADLLPFLRLQFTDQFRKDFKGADAQQRTEVQESLARVSGLLEDSAGDSASLKRDGGLLYEVYRNQFSQSGRPIGHFRVTQGRRISCTVEDGALRLRRYGEHAINDNP
ncbi:CRISPR-associated protein [Candidatus Amarolinea dominans]|uniref:CRISPR-associated protein n=1 Tax=Candidatus Amarolinea dominans TaxID=3140696 RepID=UPI001D73E757|nr:CRISPR-associated protein [Anaerolineae bacterium]